MCAVYSQPVKGRVDVPLALLAMCDTTFIMSSSALCHLSVLLAFLTSDSVFRPIKPTDQIQVQKTAEHRHEDNSSRRRATWWVNQKRQIKLICLIQMD